MDYIIKGQPMICSSHEAEKRRYRKIVGKYGHIYLYAIQPNPADNIYVSGSSDDISKGFGGRTLSFTLEDGTIEKLNAPWHTNSGDLFNHTGIDLRGKHLTFVVVSKERKTIQTERGYTTKMVDVLYEDDTPIIGKFERGEIIAQKIADELQQAVYCYIESQGGSSNGLREPKIKDSSK